MLLGMVLSRGSVVEQMIHDHAEAGAKPVCKERRPIHIQHILQPAE